MIKPVAEQTPPIQAKTNPVDAYPMVWIMQPNAITIAEANSVTMINHQSPTVKKISRSPPKRPKAPAKKPSCIAPYADFQQLGCLS